LLEDGTDHFARATPFRPEIDENREIGVDHFGLETIFGKGKSHPWNLKPGSPFVKGGKQKNFSRSGVYKLSGGSGKLAPI
jgi:hypothetical protein